METRARQAHSRVNITLPDDTLHLLDRAAPKGERSRFIADAIRHYVRETSRAYLKKRLREGALRRARRDRAIVAEWFPLEAEAWQKRR